jgi:hypothetical protein
LLLLFGTAKGSIGVVHWEHEDLCRSVGRIFRDKPAPTMREPLGPDVSITGIAMATLDDEAFEAQFTLNDGGLATCYWPIEDIKAFARSRQ